ncbi:MAG TPA: hypothetical protein VE909_11845 [Xanthobacteraceae bacterium]|nr:hypothetical protein [Xanthobacteraceae bacterium]
MAALVLPPDESDRHKINTAINQLAQGRSNAVGTLTLVANVAITVVAAANCGAGSVVLLSPLTAHAAAELGNGTVFVSAVANGSFTLTHANNAQTDRVFGFVAIG